MRLSAKADYAVRAAIELAGAEEGPVKGEVVATAQDIPLKFLENILLDMKQAGLIRSRRGPVGGYWLAKPGAEIMVADVIRAVEGPLATVRGDRPEELDYHGASGPLQDVWVALRANIRAVLEEVSLADIVDKSLPKPVVALTRDPAAWH
ncbi:MAG: Rrf2 family transcriptional regulator [Thermoleophilaceae bacterium]|nr:Rrf2 family transcriptional regulator [Thermoleophilaceae bacterium]